MFKMVIVSPLGELTQDTRIVGDTIRYRIYYGTATRFWTEIVITDPLDEALSLVTVFNDGQYDPATRIITWTMEGQLIERDAFVEFEAVIGPSKLIRNQAFLKGLGSFQRMTNNVETTVSISPTLGWIPFVEGAKPGEPPRVYMKDETTMGTTVRFDIPGVFVYEERVDGVAYQHLSIPGRATLTDVGKPELPIAGEIVEVPFGVNFTPEIVDAATTVLEGYNVYPAQPPRIDAPMNVQPFILDKTTYLTNTDYPPILAVAADEDIAVIRGHRVMFLKVNPIQYNPVTRRVTVYSFIEVRLNYNHPAQLKGIDKRIASPAFEELLKASVLNYKDPKRFYGADTEGSQEGGCDYLIIVHDAFYNENDASNPIVRLRNWKRRKGYQTRVVKVGSIPGGNTPSAIKNFIQDAYDHWNRVPSYILLVGDADLVCSFPGSQHPEEKTYKQPPIETDLYYTTVDRTDYFPDIYIGRLSADNLQQVTDIVDKILVYEQTPPTHAAFYTDISLVALFSEVQKDKKNNTIYGREGREWIASVEAIRQYLLSQSYNVERIYATDNGFPADPAALAPAEFQNGTPLPNNLLWPNYPWTGSSGDISNALNAGRFLMTYRAHGNWDRWAQPTFRNDEIKILTSNGLTPVVFSITCQTGWFDNETDDETKVGKLTNQESFTEMFLRQPNSGAVAILGLTRNSWGGYNDFIVFGMYKAIWPDFAPNPPWSGYATVPNFTPVRLLRMGQILSFGKMFMAKAYTPDNTRKIEFEMEHLFGDPEMPIWTEAPGDLTVAHPKGIGATDVQEFVIKVTDAANGRAVLGATVVLTRSDTMVQMEQTHSDGLARFKLDSIGEGDLDITVTALTYRPYMGIIAVHRGGGGTESP